MLPKQVHYQTTLQCNRNAYIWASNTIRNMLRKETGSAIGARLGRRQAVRQRILIPPCGGSIPPAPAIYSYCRNNIQKHQEWACQVNAMRSYL